MDENSTSNSQPAFPNDDEHHSNLLSSSSISSAISGEKDDDENCEDFNTNTVDSSKSLLDPAVMDDTARDTLISFSTAVHHNNNSLSKHGDDNDDENEDAGEIVSGEASDDGELLSDGEDDNTKNKEECSEGELLSSDDEMDNHDGELEECEEGEVLPERRRVKKNKAEANNNRSQIDEDLEEGEVSEDEDSMRPKSICRFFGKGQCTWGSNCRFLHPGVTDKGFYTMFENVRPPLLPNPPTAAAAVVPPPMFSKPGLLGHAPPNFPPISARSGGPPPPHPELPMHPPAVPIASPPAVPETAWERGLRHAKEMLKQSAVRKETDIDFEDKKMNQSLSEDLDKENETDYYINARKIGDEVDHERDITRRREYDPTNLDVSRERMNHRLESTKRREAPPRDANEDEMIMRRKRREAPPLISGDKPPRFPPGPPQRGRPPGPEDDWHDPWMRSSSFQRRPRRRSRSSSYSSSSDHRRRPSSGDESSPSRNRRIRKAPPRNLSPKPMRIAPPKEEPFERNSGPIPRMERGPVKRRITKSRSSSRSRKRSRSGSSSSVSSASSGARKRRDSWSSSSSSVSKSSSGSSAAYRRRGGPAAKKRHIGRKVTPPLKNSSPPPLNPPARMPPPLRQAPARPQPPPQQAPEKKRNQIKMTLKEQGKVKANKNVLDKLSDEIMGGGIDDPDDDDDDDDDSLHGTLESPVDTKPVINKKKAPGRREELLKQLKAVEEAIAKKRSKIL